MDLRLGEVLRESILVQADDTSETAFLFLTDQRLVIEFSNRREALAATVSAAFRGDPIPHVIDAPINEISHVQVIRRSAGPPVLKLTAQGRSSIWLTEHADRLAGAIGMMQGRFPAPMPPNDGHLAGSPQGPQRP
jgi:hypothetical protein